LHNVLQNQAEAYQSLFAEMEHSKATNEILAEKEKQLRRLTENTSDLVGEINIDGTFLYTSPSYYSTLGYPPGSLVGDNAFSYIHPDDKESVFSAIQRTTFSGIGEKTRLRYRCVDDSFKWFETAGTPLFSKDKQIEGFVISSRDITQQVQAEELKEKSEEREQNIINSIPMGMHMYELQPNGSLVFSGYNPAADYILQFDHSSLIGRTIEDAFPNLVETDIPTKYREVAQFGTPYDVDPVDYKDLHVGGSYEVHAFQISPMKMVAVFIDISEKRANAIALKTSEEKFSKAFYTSPDSININRMVDGVYIDTNQGFTNLTGWAREDVLGKSSLDINIWADPEDRNRLVRGLQTDGYYNNLEAGFRYKDGAIRTGIMSARIIDLNNEKCILSITRDISDRIEAQASLREAHEQLALAYSETLEGWVHALDLREHETAGHSRRVVELTKQMIEGESYNEEEKTNIYRGALLHDIGKMGVPDNILLKPGPLNDDEWKIMRNHPEYARDLIEKIPYLIPCLDIPLYHHERWDGGGYPRHLKGNDIPLPARIFSVIDVYDALLSDRPYRLAWQESEVIKYLKEQSGLQFDAQIVDQFLNMVLKGKKM
jgi:PAS domain S-box-containing protein